MKVLGQMMGHFVDWGFGVSRGGYAALDVQKAFVGTKKSHRSFEEWDDCYVSITSGVHHFQIKYKNELELRDGEYYSTEPALFSREIADQLVRDIATKELVDLDEYGMGLYYRSKLAVAVENKTTIFKETIPLEIEFSKPSPDNQDDE